MSLLRVIILLLMASMLSLPAYSQGEVPVDMFTGSPNINIPLWTLQDHDLSVPIGLAYDAKGVKLEETALFVGIGWSVYGGGSITREVRGLPDDFDGISEALVSGTNHDDRRGWLNNRIGQGTSLANEVGSFTPSVDNSATTCDELTDYNKLATLARYSDTEPDVYYVSAPGLSTAFVFDNSGTPQIKFLSLEDLKISWTKNSINDIISFTITNVAGVVYNFAATSKESISTSTTESSVELLKNEFEQYKRSIPTGHAGPVRYYREWMLTSIQSPTGANITFNYTPKDFSFTEPFYYGKRHPTNTTTNKLLLFTTARGTTYQLLNSITSSTGEKVEFLYPSSYIDYYNLITSVRISDSRKSDPYIKEFLFTHKQVIDADSEPRSFLASLQERAYCDEMPPYQFSYIGVDFNALTCAMPSPYSMSKDFWGYFNGKINTTLFPTLYVYPALDYPDKIRIDRIANYVGEEIILTGADRTPDATSMKNGTLNQIKYPLGATLTIAYEANVYLDPYTNKNYTGGGLRIRSLKYHDGMNTTADIYKEFTYEESAGISSGKILRKPTFYIPTQRYTKQDGTFLTYETLSGMASYDLWSYLLIRTEDDMTPQEIGSVSDVVYKTVTVKRPGAGSAKHIFSLPASFRDVATGEWTPTIEKFARGSGCQTMGIMSVNGAWRFPFVRNPNFYNDRGLLLNTYEYSETGVLVREIINTYQTLYKSGSSASKIWSLTFEHFPYGTAGYIFGKYYLLAEYGIVPSTSTVKTYGTGGTSLTTASEYFYEGTGHKYLSRTKVTNSDGTVYTTKIKYPLDYPLVTGTADMQSQMIGYMQTTAGANTPIEIIKKIQKPAQTEQVMAASLTKFSSFTVGKPLVHQSLMLSIANPVSDFTESQVQAGATATFTHDSRYELITEVKAYDPAYLLPVTSENPMTQSLSSVAMGYTKTLPVAQFTNATLAQVAFSDFETTTDVDFQKSTLIYGAGRTGTNAIHGSVLLSRTISKASTTKYKLSFWANTGATALSVKATFRNTSLTQLSSVTISVPATNGKYQLIERDITVSSFPATFIIEVQGQLASGSYTSSPSLVPVLDDVAFYPDFTLMASNTYEIPFGVTSSTDASGKTSYKSFDHFGRSRYVFDQDKNIVQKNTYSFKSVPDKLTAEFELPKYLFGGYFNKPARFLAWEDCHENATYEWNFGSGFVTGTREQYHTFTQYGVYPIQLRVSAPGLTTVTVSKTFYVSTLFDICAQGVQKFDPVTNTSKGIRYSCVELTTPLPPGAMVTNFHITDQPELNPAWTFKWMIRDVGSDVWQVVGTGTADYSKQITPDVTNSFEVVCEAQTPNGSIQSNIIQVTASSN